MVTLVGEVVKFFEDERANVAGMLLEGGQEVRFPMAQGHLVSLIVSSRSRVRIEGEHFSGYVAARLITNLDSNRSMVFLAPERQEHPGMPSELYPHFAASLVKTEVDRDTRALSDVASSSAAAASICRAYDHLHRVQAVLAYLHILKRQIPGISQFLDEAKHTYEQALSRYDERDFAAAVEFAAASASLCHVVQIVMERTLRGDTSLPSLVPPPPETSAASVEPAYIEEQLGLARSLLAGIHEELRNSNLPLETRTQVRKITSWADALYKQAQKMYQQMTLPDAAELTQAALAGTRSAERLCRVWNTAVRAEVGARRTSEVQQA